MNQPQPKSPIDHLVGMPPMLMCMMEERIAERLKGYRKSSVVAFCGITNLPRVIAEREYTDEERYELAKHILRRMMYKRMEAGKQFDSILESSRKYFAEAMFAAAMHSDNPTFVASTPTGAATELNLATPKVEE